MGRASNKINLGDSHMSENWMCLFSNDERTERWRKRREARNFSWMQQNSFASATKKTVKISGNMDVSTDKMDHMVEDDAIDEDYEIGFPTYVSDIDTDSESDKNGGSTSNIDVNTENDETDEEYKTHLPTCVSNIDTDSESDINGRSTSNFDVNTGYNSENDETDEEYKTHLPICVSDIDNTSDNDKIDEGGEQEMLLNKLKLDTNMSKDFTPSTESGNFENTKNGPMEEQTSGQIGSQQGLDIERGHSNKMPCQDVSSNSRKYQHRAADVEYELILNLAQASGTPEVQCGIGFDKDYHLIINPASVVDKKNSTKTTIVEDGSNFSDSEIALLEPDSFCENTPFISSKAYDSSCFEKELNPKDGRQLSLADDSQFRRKLMNYLNSPYDQEELDEFLGEVSHQRQKERHLETRQGVLKSYHFKGVNKSYRQLYPDLDKAITEFKEEPRRVLFLLRGFFFWLKNLCYQGIFEPWRDESCLEILRKM